MARTTTWWPRGKQAGLLACLCCFWPAGSRAQDRAAIDFPVPAVTVHAGQTLSDEMVVERRLLASAAALRTYHTARASVVGKVARRTIPAGQAIPIAALREVYLFNEGERVVMVYTSASLTIRASAIALEPGVKGRLVRLRNVDTGVVVSGAVRADGTVVVGET